MLVYEKGGLRVPDMTAHSIQDQNPMMRAYYGWR